VSAVRVNVPGEPVRFEDLGPSTPAPLRGFSHRPDGIPAGRIARPLPAPEPADQRRAESLARYARAYRARQREAVA
jgi:hypothetical protein